VLLDGATDFRVRRRLGFSIDQQFLEKLFAWAQASALDGDVAIGVAGVAHAQAAEAHHLASQVKDALGVSVGEHGRSMFRLFV
jgi:hypothetical protein